MIETFIVLGIMCAVAGLHSAYVAGMEAGMERTRESMRQEVFRVVRSEFARTEVSQQELAGSYRVARRLVSGLTKEMTP